MDLTPKTTHWTKESTTHLYWVVKRARDIKTVRPVHKLVVALFGPYLVRESVHKYGPGPYYSQVRKLVVGKSDPGPYFSHNAIKVRFSLR